MKLGISKPSSPAFSMLYFSQPWHYDTTVINISVSLVWYIGSQILLNGYKKLAKWWHLGPQPKPITAKPNYGPWHCSAKGRKLSQENPLQRVLFVLFISLTHLPSLRYLWQPFVILKNKHSILLANAFWKKIFLALRTRGIIFISLWVTGIWFLLKISPLN